MKRRTWIIVAVVVAVVAVAGGGIAWYLQDDAPARVSIAQDQAAPAGASTTAAAAEGSTAGPAANAAPDGDVVDGTWDMAAGQQNFIGFRINEDLTGIGSNTVVGRTPAVTASFQVAGTAVTSTTMEADLTQITTDSDRRNEALRSNGLETSIFPTVSFRQTAAVQLASVPAVGQVLSATIPGELTLHGVTKAILVPVEAERREPNLIKVVGTQTIALADYNISKPILGPVLSIADTGELELQLFFAR